MEIYKNNLEYAKKNGEREQYLQNLELCDKCGAFIRHSIAVNFNFTTKYLDVKTITAEVTEKYGFERTMLMLALRVDSLKNDGRVDIANKEWAKKLLVNYPNAEELRKIADRVFENAHPALLDSVAEEVRFTFMKMNRSKEREVEGYRIIQTVRTRICRAIMLHGTTAIMTAVYQRYRGTISHQMIHKAIFCPHTTIFIPVRSLT